MKTWIEIIRSAFNRDYFDYFRRTEVRHGWKTIMGSNFLGKGSTWRSIRFTKCKIAEGLSLFEKEIDFEINKIWISFQISKPIGGSFKERRSSKRESKKKKKQEKVCLNKLLKNIVVEKSNSIVLWSNSIFIKIQCQRGLTGKMTALFCLIYIRFVFVYIDVCHFIDLISQCHSFSNFKCFYRQISVAVVQIIINQTVICSSFVEGSCWVCFWSNSKQAQIQSLYDWQQTLAV